MRDLKLSTSVCLYYHDRALCLDLGFELLRLFRLFGKYYDYSAIPCDPIIESNNEETKTIPTNFNETKAICKIEKSYILLVILFITIALLIAVSIYCYLIKYRPKQKHLLPFHNTNNNSKQVLY